MVVGIRHTSSATSTVIVTGSPGLRRVDAVDRIRQQGHRGDRKISVRPASRIASAISFGVFCRRARFDHRDHAVEEGLARIRGDAHDQPVGEQARAAGDRAEVAARLADDRRRFAGDRALVDRADALDHLAVGGDEVAGFDEHHVAAPQGRPGHLRPACRCDAPPRSFFAITSRRAPRRLAACAFARPSAIDSAKFANSTVNQSQIVTCRMNPGEASPLPKSAWTNRIVVRMLPTYTTNITGLRACARGESLRNESTSASRSASPRKRSWVQRERLGRHDRPYFGP